MTLSQESGLPLLILDVPGAPKVETQQYHFPPARADAPPARECTLDDLVQIAADASESMTDLRTLLCSPEHVRRVCQLLVELAQAGTARVARLQRDLELCRLALDEEREAHYAATQDLEAVQDSHVTEVVERACDEALQAWRTRRRAPRRIVALHRPYWMMTL